MNANAYVATAGAILASGALLFASSREEPTAASAPDAPIRLLVLGDSLSDIGNAAAVADLVLGEPGHPVPTIGFCNPVERLLLDRDCEDLLYLRSRVTNGPVAVEHLAAHLGDDAFAPSLHLLPDRSAAGTNYAVAGATARGDGMQDFAYQLEWLLLDRDGRLPAHAWVVVMIGGNDAVDALQRAALPDVSDPEDALPAASGTDGSDRDAPNSDPDSVIAEAAEAIADGVSRLLDHGASCVVVANVPDLALLPAVRTAAAEHGIDEAVAKKSASKVAASFNAELEARLAEVEAAHAAGGAIVRFDFAAVLDTARSAAVSAGVNVRDACFDSESYTDLNGERRFHPDCAPPAEGSPPVFDAFFFWDEIHPTGAAHAAIGNALIEQAMSCASLRPG